MGIRMELVLLSVTTVGSLLAAVGTVAVLEPEDRVSTARGLSLLALGALFFPCSYALLNAAALRSAAGRALCARARLSVGDVFDINNKLVSALQAVLCCGAGALACAHACPRDVLAARHYATEAYAWFGAAYFFYDIWSMYEGHVQLSRERAGRPPPAALGAGDSPPPPRGAPARVWRFLARDPLIVLHHVFIGGVGFVVIVYLRGDLGDCVFSFAYLMELSTPYVSLRGVLSRCKLKSSPWYAANGAAMLASFLLCRVLAAPALAVMYARAQGLTVMEAVWGIPLPVKIFLTILLAPQWYWFYLMSAGAVKVLAAPAPAAPTADASTAPAAPAKAKRS